MLFRGLVGFGDWFGGFWCFVVYLVSLLVCLRLVVMFGLHAMTWWFGFDSGGLGVIVVVCG